jgi:hypothetical protein
MIWAWLADLYICAAIQDQVDGFAQKTGTARGAVRICGHRCSPVECRT